MKSLCAARIAVATVMLALAGCSPAPITRDRLVSSFRSIASSASIGMVFLALIAIAPIAAIPLMIATHSGKP